jgi:hypothetical protein
MPLKVKKPIKKKKILISVSPEILDWVSSMIADAHITQSEAFTQGILKELRQFYNGSFRLKDTK